MKRIFFSLFQSTFIQELYCDWCMSVFLIRLWFLSLLFTSTLRSVCKFKMLFLESYLYYKNREKKASKITTVLMHVCLFVKCVQLAVWWFISLVVVDLMHFAVDGLATTTTFNKDTEQNAKEIQWNLFLATLVMLRMICHFVKCDFLISGCRFDYVSSSSFPVDFLAEISWHSNYLKIT